MGREDVITASSPLVAAAVPLRSRRCLPPSNHLRISVTVVGAQSFFGHGFFNARARRHNVVLHSGTA